MDMQVTRSLCAILATDAVGYSRQMGRDEEATLRRLQAYREIIGGVVARFGGRVFGVAGDSEMAVLPGAVEALECALVIQDEIAERDADLPDERRMPLRIGINFGKALVEGEGVYGDDVNIAARVEALAGKGGICLTGSVFDRVEGKLPLGFEAYGPQRFKNIDRRIRAYRVRREPEMLGRVVPGKPPISHSHWRKVAAAALIAVAGASAWNFYLRDEMIGWRTTAAEQTAAAAAAHERARTLMTALDAAETWAAAELNRAVEFLVGGQTAARAAAERARLADAAARAEAERAQALLAALTEAEARAAAEQARAGALLSTLRETEARAREQAFAAAKHAATRAEAERAAAAERAQVERLIATLETVERMAAEDLRKGEALKASLEGDLERERVRVKALLAELQAAGQTAAAARKRAEVLIASRRVPDQETAHRVRKGAAACADSADTARPWIGNWSSQNGDATIRMNITGKGLRGQLETLSTTYQFSGGVSDTGFIRVYFVGRDHWDSGGLYGKFPNLKLQSSNNGRSFGRLHGRKFRLCS